MRGRSCTCLLAISVLMVVPGYLRGQSESVDAAPEFSVHLPGGDQRPTTSLPARLPALPPATPPRPIRFPVLSSAAGTIFSGTVTVIARHPATRSQAVETVAITFHVENAIRGASPGEDLTISQWIGLWSAGQRYRIGERVLLFLYPASKLGLTSCVAGAMGRFAIDARGRVLLSAQHLSAFRTDPVLGGKARVSFNDFATAVQRSSGTTEQ